ncbi:outer membrane protein assembly factor BamC [Mycetohabitans sp. B8]|uniref:outer membrane protein assembly factor BamC n=1 Tax=Mycetohabitans sp. B8 TaxID=2841845 RepID=UPI001F28D6D7|nr:outer membrane protein assembly factor BamC [Mycetohabitans sp. B8]MCG1042265.1 outer membrane protein assembly factor BamC [Mycetohabitans sp. B8]
MKLIQTRLISRLVAGLSIAGGVAACISPNPQAIDYKRATRAKGSSLAVPPDMTHEIADQRSLPPHGGSASLSGLQQVQQSAPASMGDAVLPPVPGMHIQREGTQRWLVIDKQAPVQVWPQVRRFWQEQGFVLSLDARDRGIMETDWYETHPQVPDGLIRNTLSKALGTGYTTGRRDKYRTRLESAPNGGTYVFISQRGLHEQLFGSNNEQSRWEDRPNDPALEAEYLKRLMQALAHNQQGGASTAAEPVAASAPKAADAATRASQAASKASKAAATPIGQTDITLAESYDDAWLRVGVALERNNFTVDDRDRTRGLYFIRYVDPNDLSSAKQGFWSQVFHGRREKAAKQYRVNVRALTETQTRVAIVGESGQVDDSKQACQILSLLIDQLR